MLVSAVSAQGIGITNIIYQNGAPAENNIQSILPNNIAFETVKLHLGLTRLTSSINPEEESLATLKELENLSKTDVIG